MSSLLKMTRRPRLHFFRGLSSALPAPEIRAFVEESSRWCNKFIIVDASAVQRQVDTWNDNLSWIEPHYALKANDSDLLLMHLRKNNLCFDVAASSEINKCMKLGIPSDKLIFSTTMKTEADLREAKRLGIGLTVFDASVELHKIRRNQGEGADVLMRLKVEDDDAQVSHLGAEKYEWPELFETVKSLGLNFRGVSFHVRSGDIRGRAEAYAKAISLANDALQLAREFGFSNLNIINIGGGFGAEENLQVMNSVLSRHRDELGAHKYKWMAEPGRYFAAYSQIAATQVLLVKKAKDKRKQQITLNDGIYGTFSCIPYDHTGLLRADDFPVDVDGNEFTDVVPTQVYGASCDGNDVIASDLPVPTDIEVGDFLAFGGMGAYTQVCATTFNGIPLAKEILYDPSPISSN